MKPSATISITRAIQLNSSVSNCSENCIVSLTLEPKWISMNFPNLLLLRLRTVFAFPNASKSGLADIHTGLKEKIVQA